MVQGWLMMKKADANIWWIIIGAVIALVVLVVLLVIFVNKTRGLESGLTECAGKSGVCVDVGVGCPGNTLSSGAFSCGTGNICCIGAPKECVIDAECGGARCVPYAGKSYCK